MNTITKTSVALLGILALGTGTNPAAAEFKELAQLDRPGLFEIRESGDKKGFRQHAQGFIKDLNLSDDQREELKDLREDGGDKDDFQEKLEDWGIDLPEKPERPGLDLTDDQQTEVKELRASGAQHDEIHELLEGWGIELPEPKIPDHIIDANLTDEQKAALKEARDSGDKGAVKSLLEGYGVEMPKHDGPFSDLSDGQKDALRDLKENEATKEQVRAQLEDWGIEVPEKPELSDEKKEQLEEARELKESGEVEEARSIFSSIFGGRKVKTDDGKETGRRGIKGFLNRFFNQ